MPAHVGRIVTNPAPGYRGGVNFTPLAHFIKSASITKAWGSEPGTAAITYYANEAANIAPGNHLTITTGGHTFWGVCKSEEGVLSSQGGNVRTLQFEDFRAYHEWDNVYCAFNIRDERNTGVNRERRFKHLLPANANSWLWTYTTTPYTTEEVLDLIFNAVTVEDNWTRVYHADQTTEPVYDIDASRGRKLRSVLAEISDKQGFVYTLQQAAYRLEWARKGVGAVPAFAADSDDRKSGSSLTGNPTRLRIIGDRNQYQIANISLERDWSPAWEAFFDPIVFEQEIFTKGTTLIDHTLPNATVIPAGTVFSAIAADPGDPEGLIARQLAVARAQEITTEEYSDLVVDTDFLDVRRFSGRPRNEMPAVLYIRNILFRAFRIPAATTFNNMLGYTVQLSDCDVVGKMVAKVTHDLSTGLMSQVTSANPNGSGYAIAQGYNVLKDVFRESTPDRFDVDTFNNLATLWGKANYSVDDAGDGAPAFIFEEPILKISSVLETPSAMNGHAVFKAEPAFIVPPIKIAATFQAEYFSHQSGVGQRDAFHQESSLYGEFALVNPAAAPVEIAYADGQTANAKAAVIAATILGQQFTSTKGSMMRHIVPDGNGIWAAGTDLTGVIDRVTVEVGPGGFTETVSFTTEAGRETFIPIRDLDRKARREPLLPGQQQLIERANLARAEAQILKVSSSARQLLMDTFRGFVGPDVRVLPVEIIGGAAGTKLAMGSPIWKLPTTVNAPTNQTRNTRAALPSAVTVAENIFVGVTIRNNEPTDRRVNVASNGDVLARVRGPVAVNADVGQVVGNDYLAETVTTGATVAGTCRQAVGAGETLLVKVSLSAAGTGSGAGTGIVWL